MTKKKDASTALNALLYKALFIPQRIRIESDDENDSEEKDQSPQGNTRSSEGTDPNDLITLNVDKELKSENSIRVEEAPDKAYTALEMDLDQIDGNFSPSNINIADGNNHIFDTSSTRVNHDIEYQYELDLSVMVPESCKAAGVMQNAENNSNVQNSGNKLNSSKFVEFWAPVQLSNVQIEQYCFTLFSNAITLCSSSKSDTVEALRGILISNRKCCNHPYLEDLALQNKIKKGPEPDKVLDAGAKASGKLQLLDHILCASKKHQLRVLILFQPTTGILSGSVPLAQILVDYVHMRFGEDSYECVVSGINPSKKLAALISFNKDMNRFIFFLETRACHPSIKLLSTDIVIIYDSDLNPANDLRWLQKISVFSQAEQIMIMRLYSKSTLEEKLFQLSEQNLTVDSRSKSRYHALLMWGASYQFDKLSQFLSQDVVNISSEESLLNAVMEEFLYLISNKCKCNNIDNSIITRVGPSNNNIKTHLPDGDQPHLFWKTLLERPYPQWKFVSISTPRQRKRPSYLLSGVEDGGVRTRRKTVNNTIEPAQLRPLTEGETGGINEGVPAVNESQSSSGNERSLHDFLKPTVSELYKVLKLSEDVKVIVETFLEFVLKNYNVNKEHTRTLHAFMISLCWIGSSLAKFEIDRSESFKLAKDHCNFSCVELEAEEVYLKLNPAKEAFLQDTKIQYALKVYIPQLQGVKPDNAKSQPSENHESSEEVVSRKLQQEIEKFNREWDEKRVNLENDKQTEKSLILFLYSNPSIIRSERLQVIDEQFATKLEEHERMREIHLKELMERQLPADNYAKNTPDVGPTLSANPIEAETHVDIESTGSHTSKEQLADAMVSSDPIEEVPAQQCDDDVENDVAEKVNSVGEIDLSQENVTNGKSGEMGMSGGNCNKVIAEDCTYDDETIPPLVYSGETGMPAGNCNKEIADNGTICSDTIEDRHETSHDDVPPPVVSVETEMPAGNWEKENDEDSIISPDTFVKNHHETGPDDMALHADSVKMEKAAGNSNKENVEDIAICPDTSMPIVEDHNATIPNDVEPLVENAEMETPAGNSNEENVNVSGNASHDGEDHNDSCGSSSTSPSANLSQDKTPLDHSVPIIPEIQDESLQQHSDIVMQDTEDEAVTISMAEPNHPSLDASQLTQITPEEPLSTTDSPHQPRLASSTPLISAEIPNQNTSQPEVNMVNAPGFHNHNRVGPRILNHTDPLQAEVERLYSMKDNVSKFLEETKQRLNSEREKEIAETIAQINVKYEVKNQEVEETCHSRKKEIDTDLNKVAMNRILADAFKSKCQDLTPSGKPRVSEAGLMQQLQRFGVQPPPVRRLPSAASCSSSSPAPQPQPRRQPPLEIVHQPSSLFSSRPQPQSLNTATPSTTPAVNPITSSSSLSILPAGTNQIASSSMQKRPSAAKTSHIRPSAPHMRPLATNEIHTSAPLIRSLASSEQRHMRPLVSNEIRYPPPHMRPVRAPAPHIRPFRSTDIGTHPRELSGQHVTLTSNSQSPVLPPKGMPTPLSSSPDLACFP